MGLLPGHTEMLILPLSEKEVRERLYQVVYPLSHNQPMAAYKEKDEFLFNGQVKKGHFRISRRVKHSNSFLPLVGGSVEETRKGCIIHISYSLFPSTRAFLWFALTVSLLTAVIFLVQEQLLYALIGIITGVSCYAVARVSFSRALEECRLRLLPVFE
ncbi:hypothetical protein AB9P05_09880 [Roseivirga sp. BDSF3-8]|uniref:hypothetical protein n=1 Tax=Roseivirga sp. BDSF3-8 TaxID=3241598 RepID=UPI003531CD63